MSGFIKKIWKDRVTEFPTRRSLTKQDGSVELVTVAREEGTVSQEGDAFSAQNMNDLEERVKTAFDAVDNSLNGINVYVGNDEKLHFVDSAGADTALPFSSKSTLDLLWTNPTPDNTFPAQTLSVDSAGYNYLGISLYDPQQQQISIVKKTDTNMFICGGEQSEGIGMYRGRFITSISDSKIVFGTGIVFHTGGASSHANHGRPYKIYGLKIKE